LIQVSGYKFSISETSAISMLATMALQKPEILHCRRNLWLAHISDCIILSETALFSKTLLDLLTWTEMSHQTTVHRMNNHDT